MKILAEDYFEEGGWFVTDEFELFEVPQYGGEPRSYGKYGSLEEAVGVGKTFT